MAAKKKNLTPKAGKLANPVVPVKDLNPSKADATYQADSRGPGDQDGNAEQAARQRMPGEKASHGARPARR